MSEADSDRSPDRESVDYYVEAAKSRAAKNGIGIGVAVIRSEYKEGKRVWECIVTDVNEWHYIDVIGQDLGSFEELAPEQIEEGVERFAAGEQADYRLRAVQNANPLHVDREGEVTD